MLPPFKEIKFLFLIALISALIKACFLIPNKNYFWFDQARDAVIVQELLHGDLKLQGPSASGTNDQIYHGVMYYYLLASFYWLLQGNPFLVTLVLSSIVSFAFVFPIYFLVKSLMKDKRIALLSTIFISFNIENLSLGVWLSNPIITLITIPCFYLFLWYVFFQEKKQYLFFLIVSLALSNQAAVWTLYLFIPLGLSYFYLALKKKKLFLFSANQFFMAGVLYLILVFSMILTQWKLWRLGIFNFKDSKLLMEHSQNNFHLFKQVINLYIEKVTRLFWKKQTTISLLIFITSLVYFWRQLNQKLKYFLLIWFSAIGMFLLIKPHGSVHLLIGMEIVILLPFSYIIGKLIKQKRWRILGIFLAVLFVLLHFRQMQIYKKDNYYLYGVQQGATFSDELAVIDKMYELADYGPFTFSSFTNPYSYNTTWAYLFKWYGESRHGYVPQFFGPEQEGFFGGKLLKMAAQITPNHFTIYEPDLLKNIVYTDFVNRQNEFSFVKEQYQFGGIVLEERRPNSYKDNYLYEN